MRLRALSLLAVAAIAATAATTTDGTETTEGETPTPTVCEASDFAPPLTTDGFAAAVTAPNGVTGEAQTNLFFTVDLGPDAYETTRGTLNGSLTWTVVANDYDLSVNGAVSENYQPLDPAEEFASTTVSHCQIVAVSAIDFLAPLAVEDLQLDLTLTRTN